MVSEGTSQVETPAGVFPGWIERQTLKAVPTPGYRPEEHQAALALIGDRLLADQSIARGKVSAALTAISQDPQMTRQDLTEAVFNSNSGYTLQLIWPLTGMFAGRMPRRISASTAQGYLAWLERFRRVIVPGLQAHEQTAVEMVLDSVMEAFQQAVGASTGDSAEAAREAEEASDRVDTSQPGIYVFTTPTYLAYPPFGWPTEDATRQDFRYLKTGSTSVDVSGRIQSEIRRQTGLPEPYLILAKFTADGDVDYLALERTIHRVLGEARHGPEEDGSRRRASRGAGTEWFITRLPLVVAVAEGLGLELDRDPTLIKGLNELFEECELPDWIIGL